MLLFHDPAVFGVPAGFLIPAEWNNPKGDRYPFFLSKPLPLVESRNHLTVSADYFYNNDLAYLQGGSTDRTYTASLTKTKAAKYDLKEVEDMVPTLWSFINVVYDKHALLGKHQSDTQVFTMTIEILPKPTPNKLRGSWSYCCSAGVSAAHELQIKYAKCLLLLVHVEMSRDVLTVGSTMRIPLLYRGEYSQWVERFMKYIEEQTDGEAMINSIKNGDQPLPRVTQKPIVVTSDPLALIAEKINVSKSKEKVVVSSDSEGSSSDDFSKDYEYYKTKMLLVKKDKDEQVLLAEDQAWMESNSDSDQEINANMVFKAQIEKVLSDSKASSSSADEKISE
nr:hypothetical protein [Tanacetum cinerariifolium]